MLTLSADILTDTLILILPLPLLKQLNVPPIKKTFIMLLLCSGLFVIAAAIMSASESIPSTETPASTQFEARRLVFQG